MIDTKEVLEEKQVIDWFLGMSQKSNKDITPRKLQKLLYYAYAWGLVFFNETADDIFIKMFDGKFQAWVHGPVDPEVYDQFREYRFNPIVIKDVDIPEIKNEIAKDVLQQVWDRYAQFDANQLEALTHTEIPWREAREGISSLASSNVLLNDKLIFNYYGSQLDV